MKNCSCGKKIRNEYTKCYDCQNEKDSDNDSVTTKKETIPKAIKLCVWRNYFGSSLDGICICCRRENISYLNHHTSHIQSEREGGKVSLENLAPCCMTCNLSMGTMNLNDFVRKYNLHYGLDNSLNTKI